MNTRIIFLITIFIFSNLVYGQKKDTTDLKELKKYLPFVIKAIQKDKNNVTIEKLDNRVVGIFKKPWEVKKLNQETITNIITSIIENHTLHIEQDYRKKWNLDFFSQISKNNTIKDVYNSNDILSNTFVSVSEIVLLDENNNSIIDKQGRKVQINQETDLNFYSGGIDVDFPIKKQYKNIKGSIKLTIRRFETIKYKELLKSDKNIEFDLGDIKGIKLLKVENNKAYFYLPSLIKNIKISSTDKENKTYAENAIVPIPKSVFDFGMKDNLNDESINLFIENLTVEDVYKKPQILMYQTNGTIENLYIYLKLNPIDLTSRTLEIKL